MPIRFNEISGGNAVGQTQDGFQRDGCIVYHTVWLEIIFSTMSVSTKTDTTLLFTYIPLQLWVTYVKAPSMGRLSANPNDGLAICWHQ